MHHPYYRLVMDLPLSLESEGKRDDESMWVDLSGSLLARFDFEDEAELGKCPVGTTV